jgi:ABC-type glutathione transport system ATPase component
VTVATTSPLGTAPTVIDVQNLRTRYPIGAGVVASLFTRERAFRQAVDGVSCTLRAGEVCGLAGESGCCTSTTGMTVLKRDAPSSGASSSTATICSRFATITPGALSPARRRAFFLKSVGVAQPNFTVAQSLAEPVLTPGHMAACHYLDRAAEFRAFARDLKTWRGNEAA